MNIVSYFTNYLARKEKFTWKYVVLLFLIVGLGFLLRIINLGNEPFWSDEILSLDIVTSLGSLSSIMAYLQTVEIHPPLYYVMLYFWTSWFGYGVFAVRMLSVIFGLGVIVLVFIFTRDLFKSSRVGLLAAFLIALLPMQVEFSAEARPYIIYCFFGLLSSIMLLKYINYKKIIYVVGYVIFNSIGLYLHYSYSLILIPLSLFWLVYILHKHHRRSMYNFIIWLLAHTGIFLLFYWWLQYFLYKLFLGRFDIFGFIKFFGKFRQTIFFESIFIQTIWLNVYESLSNVRSLLPIVIIVAFVFKVIFILALFYWVINNRVHIKKFFLSISFVVWMLVLPVIIFLFMPISQSLIHITVKHIIFVSIIGTIGISYIIMSQKIKMRILLVVIFVASILNLLVAVVDNDANWAHYFNLKKYAQHINQNYKEGDLIIIKSSNNRTNLNHYLLPEAQAYALFPASYLTYEYDLMGSRDNLGLIENEIQTRKTHKNGYSSIGELERKLSYLVNKNQATRIWLVSLDYEEEVTKWMLDNGWRRAMASLGYLFPVELYVKQ
jgi:uncharacterized membrane protein